jgi:hypothetical protein
LCFGLFWFGNCFGNFSKNGQYFNSSGHPVVEVVAIVIKHEGNLRHTSKDCLKGHVVKIPIFF